jgi:hypothetical protein
MKLVIHTDSTPEQAEAFIAELQPAFSIDAPQVIQTQSSAPDRSMFWANLIGQPDEWLAPLKTAAAAFLARLPESLGTEGPERQATIAAALDHDTSAKLAEAAGALWGAKSRLPETANLVIGLPLPASPLSAGLKIECQSREELAWLLAHFTARIERIDKFLALATGDGRGPAGAAYLAGNPDGSIKLEWMENETHEQRHTTIA